MRGWAVSFPAEVCWVMSSVSNDKTTGKQESGLISVIQVTASVLGMENKKKLMTF